MIKPGIYKVMNPERYYSLDAVGSSMVRDMVVSPLHCWANHIWEDRETKGTERQEAGRVIHAAVFEPERFAESFAVEPSLADYPNALRTGDQLRDFCRQCGLKTSGTKDALIERIRWAMDEEQSSEKIKGVSLWADIEDRFRVEAGEREPIGKELHAEALAARKQVATVLAYNKIKIAMRELTIIWRDKETRLLCRARLDGLCKGGAVDLKNVSFVRGWRMPIMDSFIRHLRFNDYGLQAAHYMEGIKQAAKMIERGGIKGLSEKDEKVFLKAAESDKFYFVMRQFGTISDCHLFEWGGDTEYARACRSSWRVLMGEIAALKKRREKQPWYSPSHKKEIGDMDMGVL